MDLMDYTGADLVYHLRCLVAAWAGPPIYTIHVSGLSEKENKYVFRIFFDRENAPLWIFPTTEPCYA